MIGYDSNDYHPDWLILLDLGLNYEEIITVGHENDFPKRMSEKIGADERYILNYLQNAERHLEEVEVIHNTPNKLVYDVEEYEEGLIEEVVNETGNSSPAFL